ncbi:SLC15A4 [Branchiostoma lanceolatum]|uniref:SLC15A4 protein n=1 Tax=Branchiostoma lanceolatum TaxID=7740 RepID=A0A8K0E9Y7_BRALA|nr:SLC15A4 [Branchiostoma lanceolatum]
MEERALPREDDLLERTPLLSLDLPPSYSHQDGSYPRHQDVKGRDDSPPREPWNNNGVPVFITFCIFMVEVCERIAYYAIVSNLVLYCTRDLDYTSTEAVIISLVFSGSGCFLSPLGGYLADSCAGRYRTIVGGCLLLACGMALLPVAAFPYVELFGEEYDLGQETERGVFLIGLFLVAVGQGGIKPNVGPFAAQQTTEMTMETERSFFNWFFWMLNLGAGFSLAVIAWIQQDASFWIGFLIPVITSGITLLTLLICRCAGRIKAEEPRGSAVSTVTLILRDAVKNRLRHGSHRHVDQGILDYAKEEFGGRWCETRVEEVRTLGRLVPIFLLQIMYRVVFFQMQTSYFLQGERMDLRLFSSDEEDPENEPWSMPVAALNLFYVVPVMVLVPTMDKIVYPFLDRKGIHLTMLKRIGIGMFLGIVSICVAAFVEIARKRVMEEDGGSFQQVVAGEAFESSTLSIFWQVPQFTLIGLAEVFAMTAGIQFAYTEAPRDLRGLLQGCFSLTVGLGGYMGSVVAEVVNVATDAGGDDWFPEELNDGFVERYFFLLAAMLAVNLAAFISVARGYTYVATPTNGQLIRKLYVIEEEDDMMLAATPNGSTRSRRNSNSSGF